MEFNLYCLFAHRYPRVVIFFQIVQKLAILEMDLLLKGVYNCHVAS